MKRFSNLEKNDVSKKLLLLLREQIFTLAHAFVVIRREGFKINIVEIDGLRIASKTAEKNEKHVNVEVVNGIIKRSWID